uniref:glutathione synthetase-like n=1 Tax=Styela clava TaxID=7725 RepID=UPI00193959CB|nr:glutathione synthetase-like [Styela clava]XP_039249413.1 glutathione synthetase-like [Styela clava]
MSSGNSIIEHHFENVFQSEELLKKCSTSAIEEAKKQNFFFQWYDDDESRKPYDKMAPFCLFPSRIPVDVMRRVNQVCPDFHKLHHNVSFDFDFVKKGLDSVTKTDSFVEKLFGIYERASKAVNREDRYELSITRADYMVTKTAEGIQLPKLLEWSVSGWGFGVASFLEQIYKRSLQEAKIRFEQGFGGTDMTLRLAKMFIKTLKLHNNSNAGILIVVCEQYFGLIECYDLKDKIFKIYHDVFVDILTLQEVSKNVTLGGQKELLVNGREYGVVFLLTGFEEHEYQTEQDWFARELMEYSTAILCPNIFHSIVELNKIMEVMSRPKHMEKYVDDAEARLIRNALVKYRTLEQGNAGDMNAKLGITNPHEYVLKDQREGGVKYFREDVKEILENLQGTHERGQYILVDYIKPVVGKNVMIFSDENPDLTVVNTVTEIATFGAFLTKGRNILANECFGNISRTKNYGVDAISTSKGNFALDLILTT